jgi:hypothetical protein
MAPSTAGTKFRRKLLRNHGVCFSSHHACTVFLLECLLWCSPIVFAMMFCNSTTACVGSLVGAAYSSHALFWFLVVTLLESSSNSTTPVLPSVFFFFFFLPVCFLWRRTRPPTRHTVLCCAPVSSSHHCLRLRRPIPTNRSVFTRQFRLAARLVRPSSLLPLFGCLVSLVLARNCAKVARNCAPCP